LPRTDSTRRNSSASYQLPSKDIVMRKAKPKAAADRIDDIPP